MTAPPDNSDFLPMIGYGSAWADVYDEMWQDITSADLVSEVLAGLAGDGPALEFGIGTGRVAIPLAARGVPVHGVELSPEMLQKLHAKPGAERLTTTLGDVTELQLDKKFTLVYILVSTFFMLQTQENQIRAFASAARHLVPGGLFLIEGFVHDRARFVNNQYVAAAQVEANLVDLHVTRHDPLTQTLYVQHVMLREAGVKFLPNVIRYVWPSEMDLMARLAGMRLHERWSGWDRGAFTASSTAQIAIYRKD